MVWKNISLWTKIWTPIISLLILFPIVWYINEKFIKGSTLLYETGITFMFFFGLAAISAAIWGIGIWIKSLKK